MGKNVIMLEIVESKMNKTSHSFRQARWRIRINLRFKRVRNTRRWPFQKKKKENSKSMRTRTSKKGDTQEQQDLDFTIEEALRSMPGLARDAHLNLLE